MTAWETQTGALQFNVSLVIIIYSLSSNICPESILYSGQILFYKSIGSGTVRRKPDTRTY